MSNVDSIFIFILTEIIATRGYFANWPLASIFNAAGIPLNPWLAYVDDVSAADKAKCALEPTIDYGETLQITEYAASYFR